MKEAIAHLAHAAKKSFGLSVAVLLTMLNADKAQATDKVILATGNNLETTFGQMPSNSDGRGYDITTDERFDPSSPTEANSPAGGDPTLTALMNGVTARGISKIPLEELKKILLEANNERLVKLKKDMKNDPKPYLEQLVKLKRFITDIEQQIKNKEAEQELANLKAESDAKIAAKEANIAKIDTEKEALDKEKANGIAGQEATKAEIVGIKTGQEVTKNDINQTKKKLEIIQTNSNPPE